MFATVLFGLVFVVLFIIYTKFRYSYWDRKGIAQIEPILFFGNGKKIYNGELSMGSSFLEFYKEFRSKKLDYGGIYFIFEPFLIATSTDFIKQILITDFQHWTGHGVFHHKKDFLTENLFNMDGLEWKELRAKLTPAFTSTKLKASLPIIMKKINQLDNIIQTEVVNGKSIDVKELCHRLATDVTSCIGFGIDFNTLEHPKCQFRHYLVEMFKIGKLRPLLEMIVPWSVLGYLTYKSHLGPELEKYYSNFVNMVINNNDTTFQLNNSYFEILRELKKNDIIKDDKQMVAECFLFLIAAVDTTAVSTSYCLWELAKNPDIQKELLKEVNTVTKRYKDEITYESILEMKYLDNVVKETLRLHTVFPVIFRSCTKDYKLPGTATVLKKGTRVAIPIIGVHMDAEYYPDPEVFNPNNFSEENLRNRPDTTWLGFGDGPRKCLGYRLGLLEIKSTVASLIKKYNFTINRNKSPCGVKFAPEMKIQNTENQRIAGKGFLWTLHY